MNMIWLKLRVSQLEILQFTCMISTTLQQGVQALLQEDVLEDHAAEVRLFIWSEHFCSPNLLALYLDTRIRKPSENGGNMSVMDSEDQSTRSTSSNFANIDSSGS